MIPTGEVLVQRRVLWRENLQRRQWRKRRGVAPRLSSPE